MGIAVRSHVLQLTLMLVVMLHALMMAPLHGAAHEPAAFAAAELERHTMLTAHDAGADHHHPDGTREEQHAGHRHGHDADNHSHEVPAPAGLSNHPIPPLAGTWDTEASPEHELVASLGIERPPRR